VKFSTALFAGALLAASIQANAAENGWYAGVGVGQMTTQVDDILGSGFDFDESDTGFKVFGGYKFLPWLGVEGAYVDGGEPEISETAGGATGSLAVGVESLVGAVVFTLPLGEHFELFAKPGIALWSSTTDLRFTSDGYDDRFSQDDDGTAFFLGAGAGLNFTEHFGMRVEYEWFDVTLTYDDEEEEFYDELDASAGLWSASFIYSF
jgi:Opacity protein and related surface antigens